MFAFPTTGRSDNLLENFDLHDQIAAKTKELRDELDLDVARSQPDLFTTTAVVVAQRAAAEQVSRFCFFRARQHGAFKAP